MPLLIAGLFSGLVLRASDLAPPGPIIINEIQYNPPPTLGSDGDFEFVELHNRSDTPVDVSGWLLKDGNRDNVFVFPRDTSMGPGAYLVAARNATALRNTYGAIPQVVGDLDFALANEGEAVRLFRPNGELVDEVIYSDDLPWSEEADGNGATLERISAQDDITDFSNFAPGRESPLPGSPGRPNSQAGEISVRHDIVINEIMFNPVKDPQGDPLRHCPAEEYIELVNRGDSDVDLSGWSFQEGIGFAFPEGTLLEAGQYLVVVADEAAFREKHGDRPRTLGPYSRELRNSGEELLLVDAESRPVDYVDYDDSIPWPINPDGLKGSLELVDPYSDNDRGQAWRESATFMGTPGFENSATVRFEAAGGNSGPQVTRLRHLVSSEPERESVTSADAVRIEARVLDQDGVRSVLLEYQVVVPGDYIRKTDERFVTDWNIAEMVYEAATERYVAEIPRQPHRTLVRYRVAATDRQGIESRAPFAGDPEPNLAYFVYDGVPDYVASRRSRFGPPGHVHTHLDGVPVYFFILDAGDLQQVQNVELLPRNGYHWRLTFVHENRVYDHVRVRLRGSSTSRYGDPKRNWKVKFNKGNQFRGRFNNGRLYPRARSKINLMRGSTLRGDGGVLEATTWKIYRDSGVIAASTTHVHLRVIRTPDEHDQFGGDFFGLYLEVQEIDRNAIQDNGRPVDEEASIYKLQGAPKKRHTDCDPSTSDIDAFFRGATDIDTREWYEEHLDVPRYLAFRAATELTDNRDMDSMKNLLYYFNTSTRRWELIPWDLDNAMGPGASGDEFLHGRVPPLFPLEFKNRFRLIWQAAFDEDRLFEFVDTSSELLNELANANLDRWYRSGYETFDVRMRDLKIFIRDSRTRTLTFFRDEGIPLTPRNESPLPGMRPGPEVVLRSGAFRDPDGDRHAATRWIIIEPGGNWVLPLWSSVSETDLLSVTVPEGTLEAGKQYSFRLAHMDHTGRWSFLSQPTDFGVGSTDSTPPAVPAGLKADQVGARSVALSWRPSEDRESGLLGYWIYRDGLRLRSTLLPENHTTDFTVEPGVTYEYRVEAVNLTGLSSVPSEPLIVVLRPGGRGGWRTPDGGWDYLYSAQPGEAAQGDPIVSGGTGLLDGTWGPSLIHEWDGGRPGDGGTPGGAAVEVLSDGAEDGGPVSVLSLEDPGDPRDFVAPNNRRLMFLHDAGPGNSLDEGITLLARWRVNPSPVDSPVSSFQIPGSPFRGQIGIGHRSDSARRHFSMWLEEDRLVTNRRHSVTVVPTEFQSVWVTLRKEGDAHRLRLYLNGRAHPEIDELVSLPTSGTEATFSETYLEMGLSHRADPGAIQIDYFGYKLGVHEPRGAPGDVPLFVRGDSDGDGRVTLADAINTLSFLLGGTSDVACPDAADTDDSGQTNITDPIALLEYLFSSGRTPAAPFPDCGRDETADDLLECISPACL